MIERMEIEGRMASVAWLTDSFEPTTQDDADIVKILFDDGEQRTGVVAEPDGNSQGASVGKTTAPPKIHVHTERGVHVHVRDSDLRSLNVALRAGVPTAAQRIRAQEIDATLEAMLPTPGPSWRGAILTPREVLVYRPGLVIEERGFLSTTRIPIAWTGGVRFQIAGRWGRDVSSMSARPEEQETVFRSGTRFRVLSNEDSLVMLEEVW